MELRNRLRKTCYIIGAMLLLWITGACVVGYMSYCTWDTLSKNEKNMLGASALVLLGLIVVCLEIIHDLSVLATEPSYFEIKGGYLIRCGLGDKRHKMMRLWKVDTWRYHEYDVDINSKTIHVTDTAYVFEKDKENE